MPLCSELMSRPKKAVAGYRPERTTPGGPSRAGRGRQYCKLRWLLSPKPEFSKCIFELKMPRPVIWQRFTSTNSCHEPPLAPTPPVRSFIFHLQHPPRPFVHFFFTSSSHPPVRSFLFHVEAGSERTWLCAVSRGRAENRIDFFCFSAT